MANTSNAIQVINEKWTDTFKGKKFAELGKSEDYAFQALSFLGEASAKLAIARTIMSQSPMFLEEQNAYLKLKTIQNELHDLQYDIRSFVNKL